jgi:hypothetical protein
MINLHKSYLPSHFLFITDRNKSAATAIVVFTLSSFAFPVPSFSSYPDAVRNLSEETISTVMQADRSYYPEVHSFLITGVVQFSIK